MSAFTTIILIIGFLGLAEGILVSLSPKWSVHVLRAFVKNEDNMKRAGLIELAISIILILLAINIQ